MKKHKSVVALLLAVMMVFTMMPMMAFAADESKAEWAGDYSTVKIGGYTYNTVRTYSNGVITAVADPNTDVAWAIPSDAVTYVDLNYAELATSNTATLKASYNNGTAATGTYPGIGSVQYVKLGVPDYVANKSAAYGATAKAEAVFKGLNDLNAAWTATAEGDKDYKANSKEAQEFTISVSGTWSGTQAEPYLYGVIPSKKVSILAAALDPSDAKYFFDGDEDATFVDEVTANLYKTYYDGASHTFAATAVAGWTPSYSVFNTTTGKYDSVSAVTVSDVQDKNTEVKVQWTKAGDSTPTAAYDKVFYVNLKKAGKALIGFDKYLHTVSGTTYNAADYVVAVPEVTYDKGMSDEKKVEARILDAATAKAVEANKADLIAYFNELNEVVATVSEFNPNRVDLSFDSKDLTGKERDAINEKYAALRNRLGIGTGLPVAVVGLNGVDLTDYEIEFTNVPAKKVIKTKKAKSTKTVKFNAVAECKNGTLVKYKLINAPKKSISIDANTGKITVKKGLAKGTYTFKVKAYIPASRVDAELWSEGSTAVSEIQTVKVIVKKTKK